MMVLITVVSDSVVVSFDRVVDEAVIEVEKISRHDIRTIPVSGSNYKSIKPGKKGTYRISVKIGNRKFSKKVTVS